LNIFFRVKKTCCITVYIQTPCASGPKYNELIYHSITLLAASIVIGEGKGGWGQEDYGCVGIVMFVTILVSSKFIVFNPTVNV
jgi:hypothetical protein